MTKTRQLDNFDTLIKSRRVLFFSLLVVFVFVTPLSFADSHPPELFSNDNLNVIQSNQAISPSSSQFVIQSELVAADVSALNSDEISVTMFGETITISKDRTTVRGATDYTWFGSGTDINAVLVVNGTEIIGSIDNGDKTFSIDVTQDGSMHILQEIDTPNLPPEYGYAANENAYDLMAAVSSLTTSQNAKIALLEDSYIGGYDYSNNKITIDVFGAFTSAFDDENSRPSSKILSAIEKANDSYNDNHLPLQLNLVDTDEIRGYSEVSVVADLANLQLDSDLSRARAEGVNLNADVVVLFTHYPDTYRICGQAADILSDSATTSYAVVRDTCIGGHTFAHEVGHLQGARHDPDADSTNSPFVYGHGWFDESIRKRTIMSLDNSLCDDPRTSFVETCVRQGLWSDPHDSFIGSSDPAGTENRNWNAKVLFATGEHIASLRGTAQTYDDTRPTGAIAVSPDVITSGSTVDITATFNEDIHPRYSPKIIINDATTVTTETMTRSSDTVFTYSHTLTTETGIVDLSFSTARDIYGNDVIAIPTSGGSFEIIVLDTTNPRIDTINRQSPLTESTTESTLTFRVTFDEDVQGVGNSDFATSSNASVTGLIIVSASVYDVQVTVTANGDVTLSLNSGHGITDTATNALTNLTPINTAQKFIVTLPDDTAPTFDTLPQDLSFEAQATITELSSLSLGNVEISDDTDDNPLLTNNATGTMGLGDRVIQWNATDASGNRAHAYQDITIKDETDPVITAPADEEFEYGDDVILSGVVATDHFLDMTIHNATDFEFPLGDTIVLWTANDTSGNFANDTQKVTLEDTTPPVFTKLPGDYVMGAQSKQLPLSFSTTDFGEIIAEDPFFDKLVHNATNYLFPVGNTTILWTANDIFGNIETYAQTITVEIDNSRFCGIKMAGFSAVLQGNSQDNILNASAYDSPVLILGHGGNDIIYGGSGNDCIYTHAGDDTVYAGEGDDKVWDIIFRWANMTDYSEGNDIYYLGPGDDQIWDDFGENIIYGGAGNDRISSHNANNTIYGEGGIDNITTGDGDDIIYGGPDRDVIYAGMGTNTIYGGDGNDTLWGSGIDHIFGEGGRDEIIGHGGFYSTLYSSLSTSNPLIDGGSDGDFCVLQYKVNATSCEELYDFNEWMLGIGPVPSWYYE